MVEGRAQVGTEELGETEMRELGDLVASLVSEAILREQVVGVSAE